MLKNIELWGFFFLSSLLTSLPKKILVRLFTKAGKKINGINYLLGILQISDQGRWIKRLFRENKEYDEANQAYQGLISLLAEYSYSEAKLGHWRGILQINLQALQINFLLGFITLFLS